MKTWYMIIDIAKCIGCYNCVLACKDEHVDNEWPGYSLPQPRHGHYWINIIRTERGQYPQVDISYLPVLCMHCDDAPCIKKGNGAIYRRKDGIVIIDPHKAKGEEELISSCPFGMIWWNKDREIAQKCTLCAHLIDEGWGKTRCVQACPTEALQIKYLEEEEISHIVKSERLEPLHPEYHTRPHVYYKNLHLYNKHFIAGSVALKQGDNTLDCVEGARVALLQNGMLVGETVTDCFGDFKFDGLPREGGKYILEIFFEGYERKTVAVELTASINIGVIVLN